MDFGALLSTAQKNEGNNKKEIKYYSTKFEPPKKEQRNKTLSVNIKNFLAKKEAEEKRKAEEERRKREELLALRSKDKKATRRVNVMLKRTKSANQAVIQDAVDKDNTAVTLVGPSQPDEDDYGYVSQEAAAFYNKMMEKYSKMPEEPKFSLKKKKVDSNLNGTRDRIKAAIEREKEEAMLPHRRKRKHKEDGTVDQEEPEEAPPQKTKPRPPPPVMNFAELLKVAEKKQFEPIVIEPKNTKEEERPLTKKQKKEMEREREWRERKEKGLTNPKPPDSNVKPIDKNRIPKLNKPTAEINRIPKVNGQSEKTPKTSSDRDNKLNGSVIPKTTKTPEGVPKTNLVPNKSIKPMMDSNRITKPENMKQPVRLNGSSSNSSGSNPLKTPTASEKINSKSVMPTKTPFKKEDVNRSVDKFKKPVPSDVKPKPRPEVAKELKPKQFPPADLKPKQFPPKDLKPKQFPPSDVRRKEFPPRDIKRRPIVDNRKRRILDDDEEEYDSEMDDFIDDGPEEGEDYSKYISEIFGYDKNKYRYLDDDIDDMESSFAQQMREEVISTKIGIMEDLEDMKKEEEAKRRKAIMKKRQKL